MDSEQVVMASERIEIAQRALRDLAAVDGVTMRVFEYGLPTSAVIVFGGVRYCDTCENLRIDTGTPCQHCAGDTGTREDAQ